MSRMFYTLKEAAQTLHVREDQIETLLDRGLLREYREGPHRLLKRTDVGVLAVKRRRRTNVPRPVPPPSPAQRPSPTPGAKAKAGHPAETRRPPSAAAVSRPPRSRQAEDGDKRTHGQGPRTKDRVRRRESHSRVNPARSTGPLPAARPSEPWSVRQWLWMGLIQDRPAAIALLSGLVLLVLSALAVGLCVLAESR